MTTRIHNAPGRDRVKHQSPPTSIELAIPIDATEVSRMQASAEADAPAYAALVVADEADYTFADSLLTDVVRRKDALDTMRKSATAPMREAIKTVDGWFKPVLTLLADAEAHVKRAMGAYRLERDAREAEARAIAADAAAEGDAATLIEALTLAADAAEKPEGRATTTFVWTVKRVIRELLPTEYLMPDERKIAAVARAHRGEEPPVIPGVVFEREARIGARR